MKIIEQSVEILTPIDRATIYGQIERAARTCYKSEDKMTEESSAKMIKALVAHEHLAMLEHASISVKFIVDRGVSHEIVRHRVASYAQESTRYCNYGADKFGREITVIAPLELQEGTLQYALWKESCECAELAYLNLLNLGIKPQDARDVLPTCTKTEIVVTMNLREWIHFFNLRALGTTGAPHPKIKQVAIQLLEVLGKELPAVFGAQLDAIRYQ